MPPLGPLLPLMPVGPGLLDPVPPLRLLRFPGLFCLPDLLGLLDPLEPPDELPDVLEELPELLEPLMPTRLLLPRLSPLDSRPAFPLSLPIHPPPHSARVYFYQLTSSA